MVNSVSRFGDGTLSENSPRRVYYMYVIRNLYFYKEKENN